MERFGLEASKGLVWAFKPKNSVHENNHNLVDKLSKLVDIEEDPYEPIDLVEEVMGNDKNAVCVVMSLTGENSYNCTLCGKGFISRNHPNRHIKTHCAMNPWGESKSLFFVWQGFHLLEPPKDTHEDSYWRESISLCYIWKGFICRNHINRHMTSHARVIIYHSALCGN